MLFFEFFSPCNNLNMFIRIKKRNNTEKKSVQIVKSFREGNKVRQKVIQTIGYAFDKDTLDKLVDVAEHLKEKLLQEEQTNLFSPKMIANDHIKAKNNIENQQKELAV